MEAVPASGAGRQVRRVLRSLCLAIEGLCPAKGFHFGSCPNRIIRSAALEGGLEGLFTPHLVFEGHGCGICQAHCPSDPLAIRVKKG